MIKYLWKSPGEGKILYDPQLVLKTWVILQIIREGFERFENWNKKGAVDHMNMIRWLKEKRIKGGDSTVVKSAHFS